MSSNPNPNPKAVYQKTSDILAVFQNHIDNGCTHCLAILRSGLRPPITTPDADDDTDSVTKRFGYD